MNVTRHLTRHGALLRPALEACLDGVAARALGIVELKRSIEVRFTQREVGHDDVLLKKCLGGRNRVSWRRFRWLRDGSMTTVCDVYSCTRWRCHERCAVRGLRCSHGTRRATRPGRAAGSGQ